MACGFHAKLGFPELKPGWNFGTLYIFDYIHLAYSWAEENEPQTRRWVHANQTDTLYRISNLTYGIAAEFAPPSIELVNQSAHISIYQPQ